VPSTKNKRAMNINCNLSSTRACEVDTIRANPAQKAMVAVVEQRKSKWKNF